MAVAKKIPFQEHKVKRMTVIPNTLSSRALDCNKWGFLMMMVSLHEHHA